MDSQGRPADGDDQLGPGMGGRAGIDECNRALNKADVGVNKDFPIQLTDNTNVPAVGKKYDIGFDFKKHYTDMWNAAKK